MNNELLDEVYNNYLTYIHDVVQGENQIYGDWYGKEEFINKCKTDTEFSDEWGLKIEERELSEQERKNIYDKSSWIKDVFPTDENGWNKLLNDFNIPTKLTTITYKEQTIESYD